MKSEDKKKVLVWSVTSLGAKLGLFAVLFRIWPLLLLSLACDVADGALARRLNVACDDGAQFDWTVDVAVCGALLATLPIIPSIVVGYICLSAWIYSKLLAKRVSGRTLTTVVWVYFHFHGQ